MSSTTSPVRELTKTTAILTIVSGAIALLFGILVIVFPKASLLVLGVLFGIELIVTGIIRLIVGFTDQELRGWRKGLTIAFAVLVAIAGVVCILNPGLSIFTLLVVLAIGWLIDGVMHVVVGAQNPRGQRLWKIVIGGVYMVGGLVLLTSPVTSVVVLALLGGWILVAFGVITLIAGIIGMRASSQIA